MPFVFVVRACFYTVGLTIIGDVLTMHRKHRSWGQLTILWGWIWFWNESVNHLVCAKSFLPVSLFRLVLLIPVELADECKGEIGIIMKSCFYVDLLCKKIAIIRNSGDRWSDIFVAKVQFISIFEEWLPKVSVPLLGFCWKLANLWSCCPKLDSSNNQKMTINLSPQASCSTFPHSSNYKKLVALSSSLPHTSFPSFICYIFSVLFLYLFIQTIFFPACATKFMSSSGSAHLFSTLANVRKMRVERSEIPDRINAHNQ